MDLAGVHAALNTSHPANPSRKVGPAMPLDIGKITADVDVNMHTHWTTVAQVVGIPSKVTSGQQRRAVSKFLAELGVDAPRVIAVSYDYRERKVRITQKVHDENGSVIVRGANYVTVTHTIDVSD